MSKVRTAVEAREEGLKVPAWVPRDTYLLVHDDDGVLVAWGPEDDAEGVEALAKAFA